MAAGYPVRDSHFAHRFVRVLHKSCAAQDIGPATCFMLSVIAHTEDAGRYAGPARFWNSQLMETLGFRSPKQLEAARDKAVAAGWLVYSRDGTRAVGEYFVTIPERFQTLTDAPLETPRILSPGGMNEGTNNGKNGSTVPPGFFPNSTHEGDGKRNEKVTESGKPSYLSLSLNPNSPSSPNGEGGQGNSKGRGKSHSESFLRWYAIYPRKVGKEDAAKVFARAISRIESTRQLTPEKAIDWLCEVTVLFAASPSGQAGTYTPYPATWLNKGRYDDDHGEWSQREQPNEGSSYQEITSRRASAAPRRGFAGQPREGEGQARPAATA